MALSSLQLVAFSEVAKTGSFSKAAKNLFVTQSALSQRILALENDLETGLIIRDPKGLRLTSAGEELLRYCHIKESLEFEMLTNISAGQNIESGVIRIGGFSSVIRSVIMPAINDIIRDRPEIHVEFFVREMRELSRMLSNNEVDLIVTTNEPFRQGILNIPLGFEENVKVETAVKKGMSSADLNKIKKRSDIYLDHDPEDLTTYNFFELNRKLESKAKPSNNLKSAKSKPIKKAKSEKLKESDLPKKIESIKLRRDFLGDVYSLIDGVKLGWGSAVLPVHLVKGDKNLKIIKGYKPLKIPVMLQYFQQPYYSKLHSRVVEEICKNAPEYLKNPPKY